MYYQIPLTRDVGRKGGTRYAVRYLDGVPLYGAAMRCGHRQAGRGYGSGTHRGCGSDHAGDQYHRADVLLERCDGAAAGFRTGRAAVPSDGSCAASLVRKRIAG